MKPTISTLLLLALSLQASAEAPQEHSHEGILRATQAMLELANPQNISNAVFGLLGDKGAASGAGTVTNLKCLQQNIADQAFTNAKAARNVTGMAAALMYRALERNTTPVGGASELCDEKAANPEIAALTQHQDPASADAAAVNRGVALGLAVQLKAVGADPNLAIQTGTFPAGTIGDPTGDGHICDDSEDAAGCIHTTGMLVADVSEAEIAAHLASPSAQQQQQPPGGAAVVAQLTAPADVQRLAALALAVNQTKIAADLQGEANAKGNIFRLGAKAAAAHPNAAAAQKASAAALGAGAAPGGVPSAETLCRTAVKQTNQVSGDPGKTLLVDKEATAKCVAQVEG